MLAGFCVAMVGFGVWMYFIFATFAADPSAITNPFARELVPGLPLAAVGLAVFAAGGVVAGLGASMSRPVRRSAVTEWTARPRSAARPRRAGSSGSRRPGPAPG